MIHKKWTRLGRKTIYKSKFINLYEDKIRLHNGKVIDDYTVFERPEIIMVVATDRHDRLLIHNEYRYAVNKFMRGIVGGYRDVGESVLAGAKRELLEETGYGGGQFKLVSVYYADETKNPSKIYVIRAKNVSYKKKEMLEETENMDTHLITLKQMKKEIISGKWQSGSALASLVLSVILVE